jgi:O-antigen biosynthesis protein WbqP
VNGLGEEPLAAGEAAPGVASAEARARAIPARPAGLYGLLKRLTDVAAGLLLLVVLSPLMLLAAVLVRLSSPGPVFFRQRRIGRWSTEFMIIKFRTMRTGTPDLASHLVGPGSHHVTAVGRWLRRTSIDELPQLWNILRGEMSLVGPRPALYNQYDLIAMRQVDGVDALRPGVSGWAQIHGRDGIPMREKVERDCYYLEHCSPGLDLWILLRTTLTLFSSRGVY